MKMGPTVLREGGEMVWLEERVDYELQFISSSKWWLRQCK